MTTPPAPDAALREKLAALMAKATPLPWILHHRCGGFDMPPDIGIDESAGLGWDWVDGSGPPEPMRGIFALGADAALLMTALNNLPTILAALSRDAGADGWRSIESAPRDGTKVDLWITPPSGLLVGSGYGREPDCWFSNGKWWRHDDAYGDDNGCRKVRNATHWRPLPAPPAAQPRVGHGEEGVE